MRDGLRGAGLAAVCALLAACGGGGNGGSSGVGGTPSGLTAAAALGEKAFFDPSLSLSGTMSCATCHSPATAHAAADPDVVVPPAADRFRPPRVRGGAVPEGAPYNRKPGDAPALSPDEIDLLVEFLNTLTDG